MSKVNPHASAHFSHSKTKLFLYGPPGSGKSTLVSQAARLGYPSVDVESAGRSALAGDFVVFGMADVDVLWAKDQTWAENGEHVLLLPYKRDYAKRMAERDAEHPHKAGQNGLEIWEGFAAAADSFDSLLNTTGMTPGDSLEALFEALSPSAAAGIRGKRKAYALGHWMAEEARELVTASDGAARLDALFDCLGIILLGMMDHPFEDVKSALAAYRDAQVKRGRPVSVPHHELIQRMVSTLSSYKLAPGYPDVIIEYAVRRAEQGGFRSFQTGERQEESK